MLRFQLVFEAAEGRRMLLVDCSTNGEDPERFHYQGQELADGALVSIDDSTWLVRADVEGLWPRFVCTPAGVADRSLTVA